MACAVALELGKLSPRERARALLRRAGAHDFAGERTRAVADRQEAIRLLDGVISANKNDSAALLARGKAHNVLGDPERALADYDETIRLDVANAVALVDRGTLLAVRKGEVRKAITDFDRALSLSPKNTDALIARAEAYAMLGEYGRSLSDLDLALSLAPRSSHAYVLRGVTNARLGNVPKAYADYSIALSLDPPGRRRAGQPVGNLGQQRRYGPSHTRPRCRLDDKARQRPGLLQSGICALRAAGI